LPGAGIDSTEERPSPAATDVNEIILTFPEKLRLAAVLAARGTLREGEVLGLQRGDVDVESMTVDVRRQLFELPVRDEGLQYGEPKSKAGTRKVALPSTAAPLLIHHLENVCGSRADGVSLHGQDRQTSETEGAENCVQLRSDAVRAGTAPIPRSSTLCSDSSRECWCDDS
jgi:hypothetical protein